MVPVGASRDHELAFLALASARIGVLFGSSVDPESVPVQENLVTLGEALERAGLEASAECWDAERQLTLLPGDEERIQLAGDDVPPDRPFKLFWEGEGQGEG